MTEDTTRLQVVLEACSTLSLATVDAHGLPHAANVNFVADADLTLYWLSSPASAHSRQIVRQSRVAATAYPPFSAPAEIRGVQMHGHASTAAGERFEALWALFCAKFPYAAEMEAHARSQRFYQMRPVWARLIDNAVHFGFKHEWRL